MRRIALCLPLLVTLASPAAGQDLATTVDQRIRAIEPKVIAWRRDIHEHPELSNRETRTGELIKDGALENPRPAAIFGLHVISGIPAGMITSAQIIDGKDAADLEAHRRRGRIEDEPARDGRRGFRLFLTGR